MADSKISALTSGNPAQSGDEIPIARGGANYKITAGSIASLGGDVDGPASSVDNQIALFDSTTGKLIKAATTTGVLKASSGVIAAATSGTDYVAPAGAFSGLSWQSVQTTGFTAVAFRAYPCNTTSAAFTVTLPASPSAGDQITLTDYAGTWYTNNLTINPNGGKVNGSTSNYVANVNRWSFQLVYVDSTQGWLIYGSTNLQLPFLPPSIDYVVIGGGGGGAGAAANYIQGGGAGAGGYITATGVTSGIAAGNVLTITVGGGGSGGTTGINPSNNTSGSASSITGPAPFTTVSAAGGGYGGTYFRTASTGGSGGGGGTAIGSPGSATGQAGNTPSTSPSQGNSGGNGTGYGEGTGFSGGGGGGANGTGGNGSSGAAGAGGLAKQGPSWASSYGGAGPGGSPSTGYFAGGGGGGGGTAGGTATGGGGAGALAANPGTAGSSNTGGGGGGSAATTGPFLAGGAGGSGVVMIAYPESYLPAASTTGSPTITFSNGYRVYRWTGNGSITF